MVYLGLSYIQEELGSLVFKGVLEVSLLVNASVGLPGPVPRTRLRVVLGVGVAAKQATFSESTPVWVKPGRWLS